MADELPEHHEDHPDVISRNARHGLALFVIYLALYGGFVGLNVFYPSVLAQTVFYVGDYEIQLGGPNIAIVYGVGLIFAAFGLAIVYARLTRGPRAK